MRRLLSRFTLPVILAAVATLPFASSLSTKTLLDDSHYVFENPLLSKGVASLPKIWSGVHLMDYYPVTHTALWVEWQFLGPSPFGFRMANLAWHAVAAGLVWWAAASWRFSWPWLLAALWAVHPTNVDAVCWISQHKSTLSAVAFAGALGGYARFLATGSARWYALALLAHLLGMLAKTDVAMLPVLLVLLERWWWPRVADRPAAAPSLAILARHTAPFFVISAVVGCVAIWFMQTRVVTRSLDLGSPIERAIKAIWAYGEYWKLVLWPVNLAAVYGEPTLPRAALPAAAVIVAVVVLAHRWRRNGGDLVILGVAAMATLLLPVLYIAEQGFYRLSPLGDRYLHLPLLGPAALIAGGLAAAAAHPRLRLPARIGGAAIVAVLAALTALHGRDYQSEPTLWRAAIRNQPDAWYAHFGIASNLVWSDQDFAAAIPELQEAIAANPSHPPSHYVAGFAFLGLGRFDEAIASFQETVRLEPHYPNASLALADALLERAMPDDLEAARAALIDADALPRNSGLAACELARLEIMAGNLTAARQWLARPGLDDAGSPAHFEGLLAAAIVELAANNPAGFAGRLRQAADAMRSEGDRRRLLAWASGLTQPDLASSDAAGLRFDPVQALAALEAAEAGHANPRRIRRDRAVIRAVFTDKTQQPGF